MTAEVVIMNKGGVALAADSAVTLSSPQGTKVYDTVNKLFTLSKYEPVGIMVYGNAELMSVPWETVIKLYRERLGDGHFATLAEYTEHFLNFFNTANFFADDVQQSYVRSMSAWFFGHLVDEINKSVSAAIESEKGVTDDDVEQIVAEQVRAHAEAFDDDGVEFENLSDLDPDDFVEQYEDTINAELDRALESLPMSDDLRAIARRLPALHFIRGPLATQGGSGVVIAGFGDSEIFPSFRQIDIEGIALGRLKYVAEPCRSIDPWNDAIVRPFAQNEMVHTFMEGVDPTYAAILESGIESLLREHADFVLSTVPKLSKSKRRELATHVEKEDRELLQRFSDNMQEARRALYVDPIVGTVSALPKDELANMAESLVNLTSFKRRVSMEINSVGGPIDVAVISKGDGFVWIKRKHYFTQELNPHFVANYYRRTLEPNDD